MFDRRSFLMGLGAGIIVGALLLQLFHLGESSQSRLDDIGRQLEQGLEIDAGHPPSPDPPPAEADGDAAASPPPVEEELSDAAAEPGNGTEPAEDAAEPSGSERGLSDEGDAAVSFADAGDVGRIVIRIEPGVHLAEAAELLVRAGVLAGPEPLIGQMRAADKRVRAGYFLFPVGVSAAEDVIAVITGQPLTSAEVEQYGDLLWRDPGESQ